MDTIWICENCDFRNGDDCCTCPEMYKSTGRKPKGLFIKCSKSFTECHHKPKPDEGRLLTEEEVSKLAKSDGWTAAPESVSQAQDAKTASIKDAECQHRLDLLANASDMKCQARIETLIEKQKADTVATIGLVVSHIWQFAKGTGYPLKWEISDADRMSVLKHYGVHYQGDNCPTCEGKCKATRLKGGEG